MAGLPFDDREGMLWMDGSLIPWREGKTHVLNHGLHYASCVFEGIRVYGGKIFKLREHTDRLIESARLLGFSLPYTRDELEEATRQAAAVQRIHNGYIRPVAWRGSEMMAISARKSRTHVLIAAWEWPSYFSKEARERGLRLSLSAWARPAPTTAPTRSKAAGLYMICTLSKHAAEDAGYDDALMLDWRGYVAESTGANVFFVMNGELVTPTPDCFLDGITRRTVMELARQRGIKVVERHITLQDLEGAQEMFLTGTAAEITPVCEVDAGARGNFRFTPGKITKQLTEDYTALTMAG